VGRISLCERSFQGEGDGGYSELLTECLLTHRLLTTATTCPPWTREDSPERQGRRGAGGMLGGSSPKLRITKDLQGTRPTPALLAGVGLENGSRGRPQRR